MSSTPRASVAMKHLLFVMLISSVPMLGQDSVRTVSTEINNSKHYIYSSRKVPNVVLNGAVGLSLTVLPQPLTEYPSPAPMLDIRWRLAVPMGLQAYGRLGSNIATSLAQAGLSYSRDLGPASFGMGYSVAYVYGNLTFIDGFNTTQHRWINYPMVQASLELDKVLLSGRFELEVTTALESRIETQVVNSAGSKITGAQLTVALEQPFWKNTHVILGVTLAYSSNPYQAWFLYNTFSDRLFSSELFIGFIL